MAIKPITNTNVTNESTINRAEQTSIRSEKGNSKVVIKKGTGRNGGKGLSIGLTDIDTTVIRHMQNVMKPVVKESNELIKVPVMYGNEERWKSIRSRGVLRDKNNTIILPVIVIKRTGVAMNDAMPLSFDNDVKGKFISEVQMESQGERLIKNELTITIKGYMIPEFTDSIFGKTAEMGRGYIPKKVSFSEKLL